MPHLLPAHQSHSRAATCCQGPHSPTSCPAPVTAHGPQRALPIPRGSCLPGSSAFAVPH